MAKKAKQPKVAPLATKPAPVVHNFGGAHLVKSTLTRHLMTDGTRAIWIGKSRVDFPAQFC
jgi:hypothetical protein